MKPWAFLFLFLPQSSKSSIFGQWLKIIQRKRHKIMNKQYLRDDKLSCQQTDSRQSTVQEKWKSSKRVNSGVDVCKSLEEFQSTTIPVPYGAMTAKENLNRSKSPSEHLVQTIWKINGSRTFEGWPFRHAVNWSPSSCMHLKSSKNIFSHGTINPSNLQQHLQSSEKLRDGNRGEAK